MQFEQTVVVRAPTAPRFFQRLCHQLEYMIGYMWGSILDYRRRLVAVDGELKFMHCCSAG